MQRLLKTGQDLADVFSRYYGAQVGKQLSDLFASHINLALKVIAAKRSGDINGLNIATKQWVANSDTIAHSLAKLNSHWVEADLKSMMREHLKLESNQVSDYLNGKYSKSVVSHELSLQHALKLADSIANGIILQFPGSFR